MVAKKEVMTGYASEQLLKKYLNVSQSQLVKKKEDITIQPPLVLKIMSKDALHKTEIGGVKIVRDKNLVESSFKELLNIAKMNNLALEGILVQKFYDGEQLIIGIKKDAVFNHVILFGMGGIFTEVFEDTAIRKCPIQENDAQEMIDELRAKKIFYGFRGKKLNLDALKDALVQVSQIPAKYGTIEELDINPFILNEKEGVAVDARIVFSQ